MRLWWTHLARALPWRDPVFSGYVRRLLTLSLLLLGIFPAWAQQQRIALHDYSRDLWTSRNGLPHNTLRDIAQTPGGHLWFATWEGVARYNGLEFTVFDRASRPSLPDNGIGALHVDGAGRLWLGDSRGNVTRFDPQGNWGQWTPEAVGDYVSGPNHVLPTARSARFSSGLSVMDFLKRTTMARLTPAALAAIGPSAVRLAESEGLQAHGRSVSARLAALNDRSGA